MPKPHFVFVDWLRGLLRKRSGLSTPCSDMKYLIVGLGNPGDEYERTRHNIGFMVVDQLAAQLNIAAWQDRRYGFVANGRVKNAQLVLLKPTTFMNLSGNAVRYWTDKENIPLERTLVVCDDLSLPFGTLRLRPSGSDGGHNGLKDITQKLGTNAFARLRIGIGNDFPRGAQVDYVLGQFCDDDLQALPERLQMATEAIKAFALSGITFAMNHYNGK